jgi:hypothetical protein
MDINSNDIPGRAIAMGLSKLRSVSIRARYLFFGEYINGMAIVSTSPPEATGGLLIFISLNRVPNEMI